MSDERIPDFDPAAAREFIDWFGKLGENGSRFLSAIYSTPWTAIPFTLIFLAQVDPTGRYTSMFLNNLGTFFAYIGSTLGNAVAQLGTGVTKTVSDHLKSLGANPAGQPPAPPPPPAGTPHAWFAHARGYTAFGFNQTVASFRTAKDRDQWVTDTNGSILSHLTGNYVDETWDQDLDANGAPSGVRQNDIKLPPPKPWVIGFA